MRVLVTGGAGFIGAHTVRALVERGDEVTVLDALTQPVHEPGTEPAFPDGVRFVRGDVRDADDWARALDGADAVIHLAAYQDYLPDFSRFFAVNAAGTALLYETIVARGLDVARVVYASSQSVYGEGQVRCAEHGVVWATQRRAEDLARGDYDARCPRCGARCPEPAALGEDGAQPHNAYGVSKLAGEQAALTLGAQHGLPTVALRYAIVHGPGQSPRNAYSGLLRSACVGSLAGRAPVVFEDGAQRRDYVAIDDVVEANLIALDHPDAPGRAYNVGGTRSWTVLEVLDALNGIVEEMRAPEIGGLWRVGDVRHTVADVSALRALGWEPRTPLEDTWRAYWAWLKEQRVPGSVVEDAMREMLDRGIVRISGG